jgi:predicted TIM-barrel fold metal-dependent hydrolase
MTTSVIDCHAQVGTGETWAGPARHVDYKIELLLERAAEAGIECCCIMAPRSQSYEQPNREIGRICEKHPDKLIGFAVHSPQREAGHIEMLLTAEVKSKGMKGLKTDGHPTREVLDVVAELGIPVIYSPNPKESAELPRMFHMMVSTYPTVNFILPHLGSYRSELWWAHIQTIDLLKRYHNLYAETSGVGSYKYLEMAARELPAEKLLFGSFGPELDPRVQYHAVKLLKLPGSQEAKVLGGNIQRLLPE